MAHFLVGSVFKNFFSPKVQMIEKNFLQICKDDKIAF